MILKVLELLTTIVSPYLIQFIVDYVKSGENPYKETFPFWEIKDVEWLEWLTPEQQYGFTLALLLVLSQLTGYIIQENCWFWTQQIGAKAMNALSGMIYQKTLRISQATNKEFRSGQIINFVQTDCQKLFNVTSQLTFLVTSPLLLVFSVTAVFIELGWPFVFCVFIFGGSFFYHMWINRVRAGLQKAYMKRQDARISLTTECLTNIKMVKLYAWNKSFLNEIEEKRAQELAIWFKSMNFAALNIAGFSFFPLIMQTVGIAAYIGFIGEMTLGKAFVVMALFNLIFRPVRMLPFFLSQLIEYTIAMKRVQNFLLCDEVNTSLIDD